MFLVTSLRIEAMLFAFVANHWLQHQKVSFYFKFSKLFCDCLSFLFRVPLSSTWSCLTATLQTPPFPVLTNLPQTRHKGSSSTAALTPPPAPASSQPSPSPTSCSSSRSPSISSTLAFSAGGRMAAESP